MTGTINNVHEIRAAVERAIRYHAPLRAEFDAGWTTIEPGELRQAWDDYSLDDPFTLDPAMPSLLAHIEAEHLDEDAQVWVPLGGQGDTDYLDAVVVTNHTVTKYTVHAGEIEQTYTLPEDGPRDRISQQARVRCLYHNDTLAEVAESYDLSVRMH